MLKLVNGIDGLCLKKSPLHPLLIPGCYAKTKSRLVYGGRWLAHVVINVYISEYVGAAASPGRAVNPLHKLHLPGYPVRFSSAS
jgi:hypothetical protein